MRSESSALPLHHIKTTPLQSFWYSRVSASLPSVRESGRRNAVLRFQVGITKADTSVSAFWYSRIAASTPSVRESGRRNAVFRFRVGVKKTTVFTVVFGTPVHQRACRAYGNRAVLTAVRFSVGCKKTTELFSRFGTPDGNRTHN